MICGTYYCLLGDNTGGEEIFLRRQYSRGANTGGEAVHNASLVIQINYIGGPVQNESESEDLDTSSCDIKVVRLIQHCSANIVN